MSLKSVAIGFFCIIVAVGIPLSAWVNPNESRKATCKADAVIYAIVLNLYCSSSTVVRASNQFIKGMMLAQ